MKISPNRLEEIKWSAKKRQVVQYIFPHHRCFRYKTLFHYTLFFFAILYCSNLNGQQVEVSGSITDSTGVALANANIIAFAEHPDAKTCFAISDDNGNYRLRLKKDMPYRLAVSYLGYKKQSVSLTLSENTQHNFLLASKVNQLEGVELNYRLPVVVKPDTIIYNVEAFASGTERKVRALLKKLPGIEVDGKGNVTAQGEKITTVLVDGDIFFTGDSKMAVNNIPAGVVDQIEILDNYNQIAFLKGLQDTDDKALNIKLKDDKKKFTFGEVEIGTAIKNRYLIHPTLFYYSPKTNINLIGDLNNNGQKSFTYNDYITFEGGYPELIFDAPDPFSRTINSEVSDFLSKEDYRSDTNQFGALYIKQHLNSKTAFRSYALVNHSNSTQVIQDVNQYLDNEFPIVEHRAKEDRLNSFFSLGKLTATYEPSDRETMQLAMYFKIANNITTGNLRSVTVSDTGLFYTNHHLKSFRLAPNFRYDKKFSLAQTLSFNLNWTFEDYHIENRWITNTLFLENTLPLMENDRIEVHQKEEDPQSHLKISMKDYWVLNTHNHIYATLGYHRKKEVFKSNELQVLDNETFFNFSSNGFGNTVHFEYHDFLSGLEYKFLVKKFTTKFGMFFHHYIWNNTQGGLRTNTKVTPLLPQLKTKYSINSGESITLQYKQDIGFPMASQLTSNYSLIDFNTIFLGNPTLGYQKAENYALTYKKFNLLKRQSINVLFNYRNQRQSIKNTTMLQGIEQINSTFIFNLPETSATGLFRYSKKINNLKYTFRASYNYSEYFQIINSTTTLNISKSMSSFFKIESYFDKFPNFEFQYAYNPTVYKTHLSTFNFSERTFFLNSNYAYKGITLRAEYSNVLFINRRDNSRSDFDIANANISYQKQDSMWYFEMTASNLFNTKFKRQSSITDFLIRDQRTFVLPRIVLIKVAYTL